jgi:heme a synthase
MSVSDDSAGRYQPWLARYCVLALVVTTFLLFAGGFTTSIHAGMAFLTWPLSNGSLNPQGWLTDENMRAEHSHRLLAGVVVILSVGVVVWTQLTESRRWVRRVAVALLLVIFLQALLGGARVLFDPLNTGAPTHLVEQTFAVCHAAGAEVTLCLWVTLATVVSRGWLRNRLGAEPLRPSLRRGAMAAVVVLFLQILVGAVMRHGNYALVIPYFPAAGPSHEALPPAWTWGATVNFAHTRVGATLATLALIGLAVQVFRDPVARRHLGPGMVAILAGLAVQIWLGALVIWTLKNPDAATAHLLVGAFLLASTWRLTLLACRPAWWPPAVSPAAADPRAVPAPAISPSN